MSFERLLSHDRREFVYKVDSETYENSVLIANDIYNNDPLNSYFNEIHKNAFLSLVNANEKLLTNEKEYCKEKFIYEFELKYARHEIGEPRKCKDCNMTR